MFRMSGYSIGRSLAVATALTLLAGGQAQAFNFERVVDNSGDFESFGVPHINDDGQIGFYGAESDVSGYYIVSSDGTPSLVTDTSGDLESLDPFPKISNDGTLVGWGATDQGEDRIFTGTADGSTDVIAETNGDFESLAGGPSISGDGTVAFRGETTSEGWGIHTRQLPGAVDTVEDETGGFEAFFAPHVNQQGDISFFARHDNGGRRVVYNQQADGTRVEILDDEGDYSGILPYSAPNSHGEVAIHAVREDGTGDEIVVSDGDTLNVLAETGELFHSLNSDLAINDNGLVVFNPRMNEDGDPGDLGLYFSDGDDVHRVLEPGDELFGSTVSDIFFNHGLNASDEVAFMYVLENDETGIATTVVPEPATGAAVLLLGGTLLLRRRHRGGGRLN